MEYGLIGEKLGHSFSPLLHGKIGDYGYRLRELASEALAGFFRERQFRGINVTIPYKQAVIPFLDGLSEEARAIGAVNTVVNRDGRLIGYNTDVTGLTALIRRVTGGKPLTGKTLILGTGGTSRTALFAVRSLGGEALRVSRTPKEGAVTYEKALACHRDAAYLINTTPVGMFPQGDGMPLDPAQLPHLRGVIDAVYNPLRTPLIRRAKALRIPAEGGLYMLVAQAVAAYGLFFDTVPASELTERIFAETLREKENAVLIGMPASGKSSVGRALAERLGRPFYDSDEEIVKKIGMPIPAFFAEQGEEAFREVESRVIARLSTLGGAVIATGGGAILREENVDRLKGNGRLFWLDRSPDKLTPTADRPLSSDREALMKRYAERYHRYADACDLRLEGDGTVSEVTEALLAAFTPSHHRDHPET